MAYRTIKLLQKILAKDKEIEPIEVLEYIKEHKFPNKTNTSVPKGTIIAGLPKYSFSFESYTILVCLCSMAVLNRKFNLQKDKSFSRKNIREVIKKIEEYNDLAEHIEKILESSYYISDTFQILRNVLDMADNWVASNFQPLVKQVLVSIYQKYCDQLSQPLRKKKCVDSPMRGFARPCFNELVSSKDTNGVFWYYSGSCVGTGGFSSVYLANTVFENGLRTLDEIAVKRMPFNTSNSKMILNEISIYKSCQHSNITQYLNSYLNGKFISITMEYMNFGSLGYLLDKCISLTEYEIAYVCKNVLNAISYLHSKNIVHRDIKSDNILLNYKGEP